MKGKKYRRRYQVVKICMEEKSWVCVFFVVFGFGVLFPPPCPISFFFFLVISQQAVSIDLASSLEQLKSTRVGLLYYTFAAFYSHPAPITLNEIVVLYFGGENFFIFFKYDLPWIYGWYTIK